MSLSIICLRMRVGPRRGLILLVIKRSSPSKIMVEGDVSLAIGDAIKRATERMGLVVIFQYSTCATSAGFALWLATT